MSNLHRNIRNDDKNDEKAPYSRLFIVCGKHTTEDELRTAFEPYGHIEDIYLPKDRNTGKSRGVAYIKYSKTSSAAQAIENRHLTALENTNNHIKVMVATHKSDYHNDNDEKYKRLFIKVSKYATEQDIRKHFSAFGRLESVRIHRDKVTDESKGFAYVNYTNFAEAAKAFEECDRSYKPIFATPKDELKRSRNSLDTSNQSLSLHNSLHRDTYSNHVIKDNGIKRKNKDSVNSLIEMGEQDFDTVVVTCNRPINHKYIEKLCNIVPGLVSFKYTNDNYNGYLKSMATYESSKAAAYAVDRLHKFEFPSGEILSVKPDDNPLSKVANNLTNLVNNFKNNMDGNPDLMQLANAMAQASDLIKAATARNYLEVDCSVPLPPSQPMADSSSRVAQRCFLVFKPQPPPIAVLRDAFSRFGNLIDISTFPNKNFGFAKYATVTSAQEAIKTLHEATINGIRIKVLEADEKHSKESNITTADEDTQDSEIKRKKIDK